ncbi:MAG TPA: alanine/glycine:cation symporter family protein [Phycisphaerae bacterium]|nr:alanine/glycine:cation symporter family protein [Phycisphaerae bacterium]HRW55013.1 alanine/glycine:cation symporter family protein [Phycisphaerae bacterium]
MQSFKNFTEWFDSVVWTEYLFFLLLGCGLLFSILSKFVQWRALTHGIQVVRGKYDREDDAGHITHFQALCAALSATIGLGNIAGVGVAVTLGGPGAVFWMWIVGFFGMAIKFVECSLATMFRDEQDTPDPSSPAGMDHDADTRTLEYAGETPPDAGAAPTARGEVRGGPMWYIQKALVDPHKARGSGLWVVFKIMAIVYALIIALASFGGGNMFQSWNVGNQLATFGVDPKLTGAVIAFLVMLVIIGGIKRIGNVASKLVPFMCVVYVLGSMVVIFRNVDAIGDMFALIFRCAFSGTAGKGAFAGVGAYMAFELGLKRALFSNEAGQGSAAIAHAAARTDEPIREGVVAAMGPFIDTIIICTMTALVVLSTGVWNRPAVGTIASVDGDTIRVAMTPTEEIPEQLREVHYAELNNEHTKLWVLVERPEGNAPTFLPAIASERVVTTSPSEIAKLSEIEITIDHENEADDREGFAERVATLKAGQPVHLGIDGAEITRFALDTIYLGFGRYVILVGVCLFAFSTMISWSYYGEKGTEYLLGRAAILPYKFLFVIAIFAGCTFSQFKPVYNFSDAMTGLTVFCNLPACLLLLPTLIRAANHYFKRLDSGEMKPLR